jgi:hypothetical protein
MGLKGVDGVAGQPAPPRAIQEPVTEQTAADEAENGDRVPDALETASGGAPEVIVHNEKSLASSQDLSPEEQAINVATTEPGPVEEVIKAPDDDAAALVEGRTEPPANIAERGEPT